MSEPPEYAQGGWIPPSLTPLVNDGPAEYVLTLEQLARIRDQPHQED